MFSLFVTFMLIFGYFVSAEKAQANPSAFQRFCETSVVLNSGKYKLLPLPELIALNEKISFRRFNDFRDLTAVERLYLSSVISHRGFFQENQQFLQRVNFPEYNRVILELADLNSNGRVGRNIVFELFQTATWYALNKKKESFPKPVKRYLSLMQKQHDGEIEADLMTFSPSDAAKVAEIVEAWQTFQKQDRGAVPLGTRSLLGKLISSRLDGAQGKRPYVHVDGSPPEYSSLDIWIVRTALQWFSEDLYFDQGLRVFEGISGR